MPREIKCAECGTDLGEIRDARLRRDIVYLCNACYSQENPASNIFNYASDYDNRDSVDFLKNMFGIKD